MVRVQINKPIEVEAAVLKIHMKVRDQFEASLVDSSGNELFDQEDGYVPGFMPGDCFRLIVKGQGLKKGEKVEVLGYGRCVSNDDEPLYQIKHRPPNETAREGFPELSPEEFTAFFCRSMKCDRGTVVNRIVFERITQEEAEKWDRERKQRRSKRCLN